ncbi:ABC transporter ATP-binding protein [soil metagenome]
MSLLTITDLAVQFRTLRDPVYAVNGVSFSVDAGDTVALVGESGSGKSVTALAVLGLLADTASITRGSIDFEGTDLTKASESALCKLRGGSISMVFQDPMTSLNPLMTIGAQVREVIETHTDANRKDATRQAVELLGRVGIPDPARRAKQYPHQFSGGMRQRAVIATAIACNPRLLIADEPTTALDVTVQAQILALLRDLIGEFGMGLLLITHDLGVVAGTCRLTNVMYGGQVVESGATREMFRAPAHPYTAGLLASIPSMVGTPKEMLAAIDGQPPVLRSVPDHCSFSPRCPRRLDRCTTEVPPIDPAGTDRVVACFNPVGSSQ